MKSCEYIVLNSTSKEVVQYNSSSSFKIRLPQNINKKMCDFHNIELHSAIIPNPFINGSLVPPFLLLNSPDITGDVISSGNIRSLGMIEYDFNDTETKKFIRVDNNQNYISYPMKGNLTDLSLEILKPNGLQYDFIGSKYVVNSITPGVTSVIDIGTHGLVNGDYVYIRNITNASTNSVKTSIESEDPYLVTATTLTTITIALNTSNQSTPQYPTGVVARPLGYNSTFHNNTNGNNIMFSNGSTFSLANPTVFNTGGFSHGFSNGDKVKISNFTNGSTSHINNQMNREHQITLISATQFSIPVDLSAETASQPTTGSSAPYSFGKDSYIMDEKKQVTITFRIEN